MSAGIAPPAETAARPFASRRMAVVLVVLLPTIVQAIVVAAFGQRMFLWDEFVYVGAFRQIGEDKPWLHFVWRQHNEHRIVWTKLVIFAHAWISGWNPVVEMYASALLVGVIAWGIWTLYRAAGHARAIYFVPVSLMLCSLAHYMNILYGLMTCHYFTIAGMVWAIVFLMRRTWRALAAAVFLAFAAMVSTLNAIVIWPIGFVVLFLTRQKPARWIVWTASMAAGVFAYFREYRKPAQIPDFDWSSMSTLLRGADSFLVNAGAPLAAGDVAWARALGLMTLSAIVLLWVRVWTFDRRESHAGLVGLSLIAIGSAVSVGIARSSVGNATALESKYLLYSTLGLIAPYLGLACLPDLRGRREIVGGLTTVIGVGVIAANLAGFDSVQTWEQARRRANYIIQTIDQQPDETLASVFAPAPLRDAAAYLRATHLGPFRDVVDVLMVPRWREGVPTAAISAAAPLRAHIVCPVETLEDLGIVVAPAAGQTASGFVDVTVSENAAILARGRIDAATVRAQRYIRVEFVPPLRGCRGRDLVIDATSNNVDPKTAVHSWTYPVYYAGVTRQNGQAIERRSLGIAFNAFSYGLVE